MNNKRIDVLIATYNCAEYIEKCLDSLLCQTYKDINIIINNNGSTDSTSSILQKYTNKYKNIFVYNTKNENNISKARNFLLTKIQSYFFTFVDADDYLEPEYIETLYNLIEENNADVSICSVIRKKENKKKNLQKTNKRRKKILIFDKKEAIAEMLSSNLYNGTVYAKLMKSIHAKDIIFDEKIHYGEDLDFCFKVFQRCNKIVFSNKILYNYIIRKNSIVTSRFKPSKLTCLTCYENIIKCVTDDNDLIICAKSMYGLIAVELLYYTWRDRYKDKVLKKHLKEIIKESISYIKKNKRLSPLYRKFPLVWRLTKLM